MGPNFLKGQEVKDSLSSPRCGGLVFTSGNSAHGQ